ncbi:hypothetical protein [Sulfuracidifex metallicus]|uniref:hypothetical protein n=1 Tax=Sulfuracidifex metallicus TaxID=47303 RepID=UPI00227553A1|nr:hypothetical protein [Sulfuracidifex metallicus]MCY0849698.1 hypothetical protein [Sulfuracidifex metallicus]
MIKLNKKKEYVLAIIAFTKLGVKGAKSLAIHGGDGYPIRYKGITQAEGTMI